MEIVRTDGADYIDNPTPEEAAAVAEANAATLSSAIAEAEREAGRLALARQIALQRAQQAEAEFRAALEAEGQALQRLFNLQQAATE